MNFRLIGGRSRGRNFFPYPIPLKKGTVVKIFSWLLGSMIALIYSILKGLIWWLLLYFNHRCIIDKTQCIVSYHLALARSLYCIDLYTSAYLIIFEGIIFGFKYFLSFLISLSWRNFFFWFLNLKTLLFLYTLGFHAFGWAVLCVILLFSSFPALLTTLTLLFFLKPKVFVKLCRITLSAQPYCFKDLWRQWDHFLGALSNH